MTITQLLINYIINNGTDSEGTEVIYELDCGCMVAREEAGDEYIPCDDHDVDSIANEGKEVSDMVEDIVAIVGAPLVVSAEEEVFPEAPPAEEEIQYDALPETLESLLEEKDEETMTTVELKSTRKKAVFTITTNKGAEEVTGYKVEANVDLSLAVHKSTHSWNVTELVTGLAFAHGSTIKDAVADAQTRINNIGLAKFMDTVADSTPKAPVVEEPAVESLEDMLADDAPMVDDQATEVTEEPQEVVEEASVVTEEATEVDAVALAQELLDLINKGTNFSTLMQKVRENATAIVNGGEVKPEPKKAEETPASVPAKEEPKSSASEASAFSKFESVKILEAKDHSVKFQADDKEYIFFKNNNNKTLIREIKSNSSSYMSGKYLQHLIYDINTPMSRSLFRKVKAIMTVTAPTNKVDGGASEASAKENKGAAKNNPADTMTIQGVVIPKAWFNQYVTDKAMNEKHGKSKMSAATIIAEFEAQS